MQRSPKPRSTEDCQQHQKLRERPETGCPPALPTCSLQAPASRLRELAVAVSQPVCGACHGGPRTRVPEAPSHSPLLPHSKQPRAKPLTRPWPEPTALSKALLLRQPRPRPHRVCDRCPGCRLWSEPPPPPPWGINQHLGLHYLKAHRETFLGSNVSLMGGEGPALVCPMAGPVRLRADILGVLIFPRKINMGCMGTGRSTPSEEPSLFPRDGGLTTGQGLAGAARA